MRAPSLAAVDITVTSDQACKPYAAAAIARFQNDIPGQAALALLCQSYSYQRYPGTVLIDGRMQPWQTLSASHIKAWLATHVPDIAGTCTQQTSYQTLQQHLVSALSKPRDLLSQLVGERLEACFAEVGNQHYAPLQQQVLAAQPPRLLPLPAPAAGTRSGLGPLPLASAVGMSSGLPPLPLAPAAGMSSDPPPLPAPAAGMSSGPPSLPLAPAAGMSSGPPPLPLAPAAGMSSGLPPLPLAPAAGMSSGPPPLPAPAAGMSSGPPSLPLAPAAGMSSGPPPLPLAPAAGMSSGLPPLPLAPAAGMSSSLPPLPLAPGNPALLFSTTLGANLPLLPTGNHHATATLRS
ncbi:hypothetical protein ABPG75_004873 [Micractinium tetrahymenae]